MITKEAIEAAIAKSNTVNTQGFLYGDRHVLRDIEAERTAKTDVVIWEMTTDDYEVGHSEMLAEAERHYIRAILTAAFAAMPGPAVNDFALPQDVIDSLIAIGPVEWGVSLTQSDEKHAADLMDTLRITREHFGMTDEETGIHGVYLSGTGVVLAHTGMSPNSPQHARILTGAWNMLVDHANSAPTTPSTDIAAENESLPQDVVNLVIAAREFWDVAMDESDESAALDSALEAFSSRVPYENDPAEDRAALEGLQVMNTTQENFEEALKLEEDLPYQCDACTTPGYGFDAECRCSPSPQPSATLAAAEERGRIEERERNRAEAAEARIAELEKEKHAALTMIAMLEKRLADAERVISKQRDALQPLSDAVFNDNGDITVNLSMPTGEEFIAAYFAVRAARAYMEGK